MVFKPEKLRERLSRQFTSYNMTLRHHVFRLWFHAWNLLYVTSLQKQVTDISLVLKDSDMDSENLSSLIQLSVLRWPENRQFLSRIIYRYI